MLLRALLAFGELHENGSLTIISGTGLLVVVDQRAEKTKLRDCAVELLRSDSRITEYC